MLLVASGAAGARSTASRMVEALTGADWGTAYAEWTGAHPQATCARAVTTVFPTRPSEQWCFTCREQQGELLVESRFHLLDSAEDHACRLYELQISTSRTNAAALRRELEPALKEHRPASSVSSEATWFEHGRALWKNVRVWSSDVRVDYLYEGEPIAGPGEKGRKPALVLRSIEASLLQLRGIERATRPPAWDQAVWRPELRRELVRALQPEFPGAARLIEDPQAQMPESPRDVVLALLRAAENAAPERRAALLLAADQIGERLARTWNLNENAAAAKDWDPAIPGLTYEREDGDHGQGWTTYHHDLLARVWAERPHTVWREFAFLELQHAGWDFSTYCTRSPTPFVEVIDRGSAYLDEHPDTRWRAAQLLFLAQAHETRWTASRLVDAAVDLSSIAPHGEAARQLAIAYYGRVIAEFPQSPEAVHARERLKRAESDQPPDQWKYFCRSFV